MSSVVAPIGKPNMIQAAEALVVICDDTLPITGDENANLDVLYYKEKLNRIFQAAELLSKAIVEWNDSCAAIAYEAIHAKGNPLIAAAPELLEACKLIALAPLSHGDHAVEFMAQTAQQAIAKATGGQP